MNYSQNPSYNRTRGFSLTESAITLAILALVLTGVWVASASVNDNQKITQAHTNMAMLVNNIQRLYRGTHSISNTSNFTNDNMITAGVVPSNMIDENGKIKSVWMTDITLSAPNTTEFKIEYEDLTEENCRRLVSSIAGTGHNETLIEINVDGNAFTITAGNDDIRDLVPADSSFHNCNEAFFRFKLQ